MQHENYASYLRAEIEKRDAKIAEQEARIAALETQIIRLGAKIKGSKPAKRDTSQDIVELPRGRAG